MYSRKYKHDPEVLLAQTRALLKQSSDTRFQHKVEMVSLVFTGMTPAKLSEYSGDSRSSISGWVKIADEEGIEALRESLENTGRHPQLSEEQVNEIKTVYLRNPGQWTGEKLSEYIKKNYSVHLGKRSCQNMMALFRIAE